jgi:hypothetical protein
MSRREQSSLTQLLDESGDVARHLRAASAALLGESVHQLLL